MGGAPFLDGGFDEFFSKKFTVGNPVLRRLEVVLPRGKWIAWGRGLPGGLEVGENYAEQTKKHYYIKFRSNTKNYELSTDKKNLQKQ